MKAHAACGTTHGPDVRCPAQRSIYDELVGVDTALAKLAACRAVSNEASEHLRELPDDPSDEAVAVLVLDALERSEKAGVKLAAAQFELVRLLRAAGVSWTEIGGAVGVSRQGARQRYRRAGVR